MEAQKRLIEEAPKRVAEEKKRRREELIKRASRTDRFQRRRFVARSAPSVSSSGRQASPARKLRKHRRQGMWTFFVLCAVLLAVLFWVYSTVLKP
jgi:type VI protein secretion system component VasF